MSDKHETKDDRLYTRDHEWGLWTGEGVTVGIAAYAVDQLGDVTLVNVDVKAGDTVTAGKAFGTIESVKTLSDLFSPVSGKVLRVNADLENKPELVNEDCYGKGWMIVVDPSNAKDKDALLSPAAYRDLIGTLAH
jgi:glycine cleavage system H protein